MNRSLLSDLRTSVASTERELELTWLAKDLCQYAPPSLRARAEVTLGVRTPRAANDDFPTTMGA